MLGVLNVTVLSADNVASSFFDRSDPFVKLATKDLTLQTFVAEVSHGEHSAIWNERLVFSIDTIEKLPTDMQVTLVDKRHFGKDEVIFDKKVPLNLLSDKETLSTITVTENEGKTTVNLIVQFLPYTIMQKVYGKLDNAMEDFKKKMVAQIVDKLTSKI